MFISIDGRIEIGIGPEVAFGGVVGGGVGTVGRTLARVTSVRGSL